MMLLCTNPLRVVNKHAIVSAGMPPVMLTTALLERISRYRYNCD